MKKTLMVTVIGTMLMATAAFAEVRFGVGVNVGGPVVAGAYVGSRVVAPAPMVVNRPFVAVRPPMPGPGYIWVDGFHGPQGWVAGYWALPPYSGAYWVAPRFAGGRFVAGYWGGERFGHERFENRERSEHGEFRNGFRR